MERAGLPDSLSRIPNFANIAFEPVTTAASAAGVAQIAAWAGIHRRDELEAGRKRRLARRARDMDAARFDRLAQHFEHPAVPFRQLVEEQHAVMGQRDFAGPRIAAAADQRDRGGRVVRRAKRASPPIVGTKAAGQRLQRGGFQRLVLGKRRQQARQALRQHRFAGPRRPDHQDIVIP